MAMGLLGMELLSRASELAVARQLIRTALQRGWVNDQPLVIAVFFFV